MNAQSHTFDDRCSDLLAYKHLGWVCNEYGISRQLPPGLTFLPILFPTSLHVHADSPSSCEMAEPTFPFARLPSELKLLVLMHHTLELRSSEYARFGSNKFITDALTAFSHDSTETYSSFRPSITDLVRIHFPYEAKAIPLEHFRRYAGKDLLDWVKDNPYDPKTCFDFQWIESVNALVDQSRGSLQDEEELWWLRYIAFVANRVESIVLVLNDVFYPHFDDWFYYSMIDLWCVLSEKSRSLQDHVKFLSSTKANDMKDMLEIVGSTYAMNAYHGCLFPFKFVAEEYQRRLEWLNVSWAQFLRCGAFAICVAHYVMSLRPEHLIELFSPQYRDDQDLDDEGYPHRGFAEQSWSWLKVSTRGDDVVLGPADGTLIPTPDEFAERNRFWMMSRDVDGWEELRKFVESANKDWQMSRDWGKWWLYKHEIVDDEFIDGVNYLGHGELEEFFAE